MKRQQYSSHPDLNFLKNYHSSVEGKEIEIARELTKKFEEHIGTNINEAIKIFEKREIIGEITIVIKGISKKQILNSTKKT